MRLTCIVSCNVVSCYVSPDFKIVYYIGQIVFIANNAEAIQVILFSFPSYIIFFLIVSLFLTVSSFCKRKKEGNTSKALKTSSYFGRFNLFKYRRETVILIHNRIAALGDSATEERKQSKFRWWREKSELTIGTIKTLAYVTGCKKMLASPRPTRTREFSLIFIFSSPLLLLVHFYWFSRLWFAHSNSLKYLALYSGWSPVISALIGINFPSQRYESDSQRLWCSNAISASARIAFSRNYIRRLSRVD